MADTTIRLILVRHLGSSHTFADDVRPTDGSGEISSTSRPLKEGEVAEWVLLDGVCHRTLVHLPVLRYQ